MYMVNNSQGMISDCLTCKYIRTYIEDYLFLRGLAKFWMRAHSEAPIKWEWADIFQKKTSAWNSYILRSCCHPILFIFVSMAGLRPATHFLSARFAHPFRLALLAEVSDFCIYNFTLYLRESSISNSTTEPEWKATYTFFRIAVHTVCGCSLPISRVHGHTHI